MMEQVSDKELENVSGGDGLGVLGKLVYTCPECAQVIEENECYPFQYMTAPNEKRAICDNCGEVSAEKQKWTLF